MYTLKDYRIEKLTQKLATQWFEMEVYERDRNLSPSRCEQLLAKIAAGEFISVRWCSALLDGKEYRINGKHTSYVLSTMKSDMPAIKVFIERYNCESATDLAVLYAAFDSRMSVKLSGDINKMFAATNPKLAEIDSASLNAGITGLALNLWEREAYHHPPEARAQLCLAHPEACLYLSDFTERGKYEHRIFLRGGVAAGICRTFLKSQKDALVFWDHVKQGTETSPGSPSRVLQRWLLRTSVSFGRGAKKASQTARADEFFVRSVHAWNAWRKGTTTDLKYFASAPIPKAV